MKKIIRFLTVCVNWLLLTAGHTAAQQNIKTFTYMFVDPEYIDIDKSFSGAIRNAVKNHIPTNLAKEDTEQLNLPYIDNPGTQAGFYNTAFFIYFQIRRANDAEPGEDTDSQPFMLTIKINDLRTDRRQQLLCEKRVFKVELDELIRAILKNHVMAVLRPGTGWKKKFFIADGDSKRDCPSYIYCYNGFFKNEALLKNFYVIRHKDEGPNLLHCTAYDRNNGATFSFRKNNAADTREFKTKNCYDTPADFEAYCNYIAQCYRNN